MYNKIWVSKSADRLKIKLLTIAHAGHAGHRGRKETAFELRERSFWLGLAGNTKDFTANCLLCTMSRSGTSDPPPLPTRPHANAGGEVLNFDYLF